MQTQAKRFHNPIQDCRVRTGAQVVHGGMAFSAGSCALESLKEAKGIRMVRAGVAGRRQMPHEPQGRHYFLSQSLMFCWYTHSVLQALSPAIVFQERNTRLKVTQILDRYFQVFKYSN